MITAAHFANVKNVLFSRRLLKLLCIFPAFVIIPAGPNILSNNFIIVPTVTNKPPIALITSTVSFGTFDNKVKNPDNTTIIGAKSAISGGMRRGYAVGSNYTSVGFARMHEYGDEIRETAKGDRIYTAEQSRQMIANMKRDDDRIAGLLQQLIDKVEKLEDRVRVLPDRQLQLERGG